MTGGQIKDEFIPACLYISLGAFSSNYTLVPFTFFSSSNSPLK